ncbi:hypothetical protein NSMS1_59420 [Nostoc sp. MS1]|nr:hypothetical protein NSMS1_59420 [Nostoc sp. MS1]
MLSDIAVNSVEARTKNYVCIKNYSSTVCTYRGSKTKNQEIDYDKLNSNPYSQRLTLSPPQMVGRN